MMKLSKRMQKIREITGALDQAKKCPPKEAIEILQTCPKVKFEQTLEVSIRLGIDPKKSDQQVRGVVILPHGTGKKNTILVLAKGDKIQEALDAGADYAGNEEYFEKIRSGWLEFSALIATPDMMREVGKLGKILGPRGLMPSPKGGTITHDVAKAIQEIKKGKIEFKSDRNAMINAGVGKLNFSAEALLENLETLLQAISRAKPASSRGVFMSSFYLSSSMGPGILSEA